MKEFNDIITKSKAVSVFKSVINDSTVRKFIALLSVNSDTNEFIEAYSEFVSSLYLWGDNLGDYINALIQNDENSYVKSAAKGQASPIMQKAVDNELAFFEELAQIKSEEVKKHCEANIFLPDWANSNISICEEYKKKISQIKTTGYGIYASNRMFLYKDSEIVPVKFPDPQRLSQMSGYETERQKVIDNTMALLSGKPCNNVLLYGDAGSGKSSTVKAIVNEYWNMGLRLIEIKKNQLYSLADVIEKIADNPLKFIIFIDDLSFSASDKDFGALKAILEGGVAGKTDNIVIYATSNRRHLVKEDFSDRKGDDIHIQDTIQEITSLSARFGLKVTFSRPDKDLYLSIVENLSMQYNIVMDKNELFTTAEAFALRNGGRSPRTAKQFIEFLASQNN